MAYVTLDYMVVDHLRGIKNDLLRTRADRIGLIVLAVLVVAAVFLVFWDQPLGAWFLLFVGGGLPAVVVAAVADRSRRRRSVMIAGVSILPMYLILWVLLLIFVPGIGELFDPFSYGGPGGVSVPGVLLYGFAMVASITSFGRLTNPRSPERSREFRRRR